MRRTINKWKLWNAISDEFIHFLTTHTLLISCDLAYLHFAHIFLTIYWLKTLKSIILIDRQISTCVQSEWILLNSQRKWEIVDWLELPVKSKDTNHSYEKRSLEKNMFNRKIFLFKTFNILLDYESSKISKDLKKFDFWLIFFICIWRTSLEKQRFMKDVNRGSIENEWEGMTKNDWWHFKKIEFK